MPNVLKKWRCPNWCVFYVNSYAQGTCGICGKEEVPFDPEDPDYVRRKREHDDAYMEFLLKTFPEVDRAKEEVRS
jgi:hypothetical protein